MSAQPLPNVRRACLEDADGLRRLYAELAGDTQDALPADHDGTTKVLAEIAQQADRFLLVAEYGDGQIVGTVDLLVVKNLTHGARPWAIVENVVVAKSHQRRRIGSALMQEAIQRAKSADCYKLQLMSGKQRGPAHDFYRDLGLAAVSEGFKVYFES